MAQRKTEMRVSQCIRKKSFLCPDKKQSCGKPIRKLLCYFFSPKKESYRKQSILVRMGQPPVEIKFIQIISIFPAVSSHVANKRAVLFLGSPEVAKDRKKITREVCLLWTHVISLTKLYMQRKRLKNIS